GVVMDDPSMYRGQPFGAVLSPANDAALAETERLRAAGCATVVAMTHQAMGADRELAHRGHYPVIVGGHEHVPMVEDVGGTWIVKAGSEAVHAVITELVWEGDELRVSTVLDDVSRYPEDTELRARVEMHLAPVRELSAATMLYIEPGARLSSIGA